MRRRGKKREVVILLSLTAMVDMFTVVAVFLLQNYSTTGSVLYLPKGVVLPKATQVSELQPAVVVTISPKEVLLEETPIISYEALKAQRTWMVEPLRAKLRVALAQAKGRHEAILQNQLRDIVDGKTNQDDRSWSKVTVQADKGIDILTVKKIMYTVTEAGASEINFAVSQKR